MNTLEKYKDGIVNTIKSLQLSEINKITDVLWDSYVNNKNIFVIGNGGSASTASHWACDFSKGTIVGSKKRFKVLSLTDNIAWITAISNDISYDAIFVEQLKNFFKHGDVVIGISASGNSKNVVNAIKYCNENGGVSIAFVGFTGGVLKEISQFVSHIENNNYGQIEDTHLILNHMISQQLKRKIEEEPSV